MLQAKPERLSEDWQTAKCDESGETEFKLRELKNVVATHISGRALRNVPLYNEVTGEPVLDDEGEQLYGLTLNPGDNIIELTRFMLADIKGLVDEKGDTIQLKFNQVKIGEKNHPCLRVEYLDLFPDDLYSEILGAVRAASNPPADEGEEEEENENFTSGSEQPPDSNNAPPAEIPENAPSKDASESDLESTPKPEGTMT